MKIKSVKIQAFKSFLKAEDGCFDFTIDGEIAANFVSLYAPNGFGKTSFFDAVDFAITGKISRYSRDSRLARQNKSDCLENNQQGEKQNLLRNSEADDSIPTKIIVDVDNGNAPFISQYKPARRRSVDYPFPSSCNPGTAFFGKTMLAQEAIDGFLRETDAEGRYKKFATTVGGLEKVDEERSAFLAVKKDADDEIGLLVKNIQNLETEIAKFAGQKNPTEEANAVILRLNEAQAVSTVGFSLLKSKYTNSDHASFLSKWEVFKNTIERHKHALGTKKASAIEQLDSLLTIRRRLEQLSALEKSETQAKLLAERKQNLSKLEIEKAESQKVLEHLQSEVKLVNQWGRELEGYFGHTNAVAKLALQLKNIGEQEQKVTKQLSAVGLLLDVSRKQVGKHRLAQEQLVISEESAADHFKQLGVLDIRNKDNALKLNLLKKEKLEQDSVTLSLERKIGFIKRINISDPFDSESVNFSSPDIIIKLVARHQTYSENQKNSKSVQAKLKLIAERLDNTRLQSKQIKDLIEIAVGIISHSEQSICPLCQHQYKDLADLQNQISSNPLLDNTEKELTETYQELKHQLSVYESNIKKDAAKFAEEIQSILANLGTNLKTAQLNANTLGDQSDLLLKSIEVDKSLVMDLREKVLNKSKADFDQHLKERRDDSKKQVDAVEAAIKGGETEQKDYTLKLDVLKGELIQKRAEKVEVVEDGRRFDGFIEYLARYRKVVNVEKTELQEFFGQQSEQLKLQILSLSSKMKTSIAQITKIGDSLTLTERSQSLDELLDSRSKLVANIAELKSMLTPFYALLRELKLASPTNEDEWKGLELQMNAWIHSTSQQSSTMEAALSDATLLNALSEQALEFRNPEILKIELKKLDLKQKAYQNIGRDLSQDIEKLNSHIQTKANSYFRTELINQLYCAIDPHPEFKAIEFNCKTDGVKPRLVISAVNPSTGLKAAPSLTFSSAQINVLALSIFLAQALNVTDRDGKSVDCIFIDDPVQSIDSINSLSFIDLIRGLCLRFNKQIIISTHDQNFHELLKKKMPSNLFSAKYLRLASFGKVVND